MSDLGEGVKVIFKKMENGREYESFGYYNSEGDFNSRNNTLFFVKLTNKTKPPVVKKNEKV